MAEKGILIKEQVGGKNIATVDALALDSNSNARTIQLMDISEGHLPSPFVPVRNNVTVADGYDLDNLPADLTNNLITCGDKANLMIFTLIPNRVYNQGCRVTILLMDNEATPHCYGILDNHLQVCESELSFVASDIGIDDAVNMRLCGSAKIGIHVCGWGTTFIPGVSVYAYVY